MAQFAAYPCREMSSNLTSGERRHSYNDLNLTIYCIYRFENGNSFLPVTWAIGLKWKMYKLYRLCVGNAIVRDRQVLQSYPPTQICSWIATCSGQFIAFICLRTAIRVYRKRRMSPWTEICSKFASNLKIHELSALTSVPKLTTSSNSRPPSWFRTSSFRSQNCQNLSANTIMNDLLQDPVTRWHRRCECMCGIINMQRN
jgi:hypothetical protein